MICKRPECQLIHSTLPFSNHWVTPGCVSGFGWSQECPCLYVIVTLAPASFMCCLHDWQGLVQRGRGRGFVLQGKISCSQWELFLPLPSHAGWPHQPPKALHGGPGCGDRAALTFLQGHSPSSAHPAAILSCWGWFWNNESSGPAKTLPQDWQHQGGVIPPVVCWLLLSDPAGIDRSYSPGCWHGDGVFLADNRRENGHLCLEIYPKPQGAVASRGHTDSSARSYKCSIPSLEPSPGAF